MLTNIFADPYNSGFVTFLIGILFILSIYHYLLFFQQKDRTYLLYGSYLFLTMLTLLPKIEQGFITDLLHPQRGILPLVDIFFIELSYALYFLFVFRFLELRSRAPGWNSFMKWAIGVFLLICAGFHLAFFLSGDELYVHWSYSFFLSYIPPLAIICFIPVFRTDNPLKKYIIVGSLVLLLTSLVPVFTYILFDLLPFSNQTGYSVYFMGLIVENLIFSLGLGRKQKLLMDENLEAKRKIIGQFQENERLRRRIQEELEKNVEVLSRQAEADKLEKIKARYDKELAEMRLVSLRSQMNPHFIFNSLNSIKLYIITNEKENAVYYLNKFSKLIRKILSATTEKQTSLAEELDTMKLYVSIENIRFEGKIDFEVESDPEIYEQEVKLPGLILQPFIENALWHGLPLVTTKKKLWLRLKKLDGERLRIEIEDNGIGRQRSGELNTRKLHKRKSLGIKLTQERLRTFYRDHRQQYSLEFIDLKDGQGQARGTRVVLVLPL